MDQARVSAGMTPAHKTSAILILAGLVAGGAALLTQARATQGPVKLSPMSALDSSGIHVQAHMQSSHLLLGTDQAHMAVTLRAPLADGATLRPPVNVAIVIDRSGSMSGEKLRHAKRAARQLVNQLRATDRVAIISYGSDVDVVFRSERATQVTKSAAYRAIDGIYDDGGTNLSGGLLAGRDEITSNPETGAVERIVLISDGLANEGIINRDRLAAMAAQTAERGISITTVGVGLDFDEETMTQVAVSGRGNYYFAESSSILADLFAQELDKLSATIATHARIVLSPGPGVEIVEAYGYPMESNGRDVLVPIADLHAGEIRKVVFRMRVDAHAVGAMHIANIEASFRPTDSMSQRSLNIAASAVVTDRQETVLAGRDREAVRHIERARTAEAINEATRQYESGNTAAAIQVLNARRQQVKSIASSMDDDELGAEMQQVADEADKEFAAPAKSEAGQRARKKNRASAYDLLR